MDESRRVYVIGGGPAGLAAAAELRRRGLDKMAGQLGVLDQDGMPKVHGGPPAAPGLFFLGYTVSLRGMLRDIAAGARRVAPAVARDYQSGPR